MKFQIEFTDDVIMKAHCDNISEQATELKALFYRIIKF